MSTVLVTGGTGFLGQHLVQRLVRRGDRVRVLVRPTSPRGVLDGLDVEWVEGDLSDQDSLRRAVQGAELVFHVAAHIGHGLRDLPRLRRDNVHGTAAVVRAAREAGVRRLVHTSSVAAVGVPQDERPADEGWAFHADERGLPYFWSKHQAEREVLAAVDQGLDAVMLNPGVILGPGDHRFQSGRVFQLLARCPLPVYPTGGTGVVDVRDVADAHLAALERGRTGRRYILVAENLSYRELLAGAAATMGRGAPWLPIPGAALRAAGWGLAAVTPLLGRRLPATPAFLRLGARCTYYDASRARDELGLCFRPVEETLRDAAAWYAEHGLIRRRPLDARPRSRDDD